MASSEIVLVQSQAEPLADFRSVSRRQNLETVALVEIY